MSRRNVPGSCRRLFGLAAFGALTLGASAASADWPMARHDAARTGAATGVSDIKKPVSVWQSYLGGQLGLGQLITTDVTGDGEAEFVFIKAGHLVAKHADDTLVWESPLLSLTTLVGIADLDGDGTLDVVAHSTSNVYVFNGKTGAVAWAEADGEMGTVGAVRMGDLDGDGRADLLIEECGCCAVSSGNPGLAYTFKAGFGAVSPLWALPSTYCGSYQSLDIADVDGDGRAEVLHASYDRMILLDGPTGATVAESDVISPWVGTSQCRGVNVDGAPGDEIFCVLNQSAAPSVGQRRAFLLKYSATPAPALSVKWSLDLAPDAGGDAAATNPVLDLDGDGALEVVVSGRDATGTWTTHILDANTGEELAAIAGERAAGPVILGAAKSVVLTTRGRELYGYAYDPALTPKVTRLFSLMDELPLTERDFTRAPWGTLNTRLVAVDLDGDGVSELLTRGTAASAVTAYSLGSGSPVKVASIALPTGVDPVALFTTPPLGEPASRLALSRSDGYVATLDDALVPTNAKRGRPALRSAGYYAAGAYGDLRRTPRVARLGAGPAESVLVMDSRGALVRLDPATASLASPPKPTWARPNVVATSVVAGLDGANPGLACVAMREPLTTPVDYRVLALRADGTELWSVDGPSSPLADLLPGRLRAGHGPDLVLQWGSDSDRTLQYRALDGASGATLWDAAPLDPGFGRQPSGFALADDDGDGLDDIYTPGPGVKVLSGASGAALRGAGTTPYFMPTLFDVDGDGAAEITVHGGLEAARTLSPDLATTLWMGAPSDRPYPYGAVAACASGPRWVEGSWSSPSQLTITVMSGAEAGTALGLTLAGGAIYPDAAAAKAADASLGQLTSATVHSNLTGEGRPSALVGSADGYLYAVNPCDGSLDFALNMDAPVGEAVYGDTDGDGRDEILVTTADGFLHAIRNEVIAAPEGVIDTDPPRGITADDVDEIETVDTLYCAWDAVAGATSYEVAIAEEGWDIVTSPAWTDVGGALTATRTGPFVAGTRYQCVVRSRLGADVSVDALSDGVLIVAPSGAGGAGGVGGLGNGAGGAGGEDIVAEGGCACRVGVSDGPDDARALFGLAALGLIAASRRRRA